jgi:ABC-type multidrug transport system ATPase subunit
LTKRYATGAVAVDDLRFLVQPGEIYALLGATGAGKTTVFDLFLAVLRPTRGEALIDGHATPYRGLHARQHATFVSPDYTLDASRTIRQTVMFFMRVLGARPTATPVVVDNALRHAGVPERDFDRPVGQLPWGTHLLMWFAVASLRKTGAILVDEPTRGLDLPHLSEVERCVQAFRTRGTAVLLTTSDVAFATRVADRIGTLVSGRITTERTRASGLPASEATR